MPWCLVWLRLYRHGSVAWDGGRDRACRDFIRVVVLRPGQEEVRWRTLTAGEILGDSLPEGLYTGRAVIAPSRGIDPPRPEMELTLGDLILELPSENSAEGAERRTSPDRR